MHAGSLTMRGIYLKYRISKKASVMAPSDTQQTPATLRFDTRCAHGTPGDATKKRIGDVLAEAASVPVCLDTSNIARRILHEYCADASRRLATRVAQALDKVIPSVSLASTAH